MPTISDLVLEVSLDSEGQIKTKVDYDVAFTAAEKASKVHYTEDAVLYDRRGLIDSWYLNADPDSPGVDPIEGLVQMWRNIDSAAPPDNYVLILGTADVNPSDPAAEAHRSFEKTLNHWQRNKLIETGREHPYVLVSLLPQQIGATFKLTQLEIDVGDPD